METAGCCFFDLFFTLIKPEYCPDMSENEVLGLSIEEWESYAEDKALYLERAGGLVTEESKIIEDITRLLPMRVNPFQKKELLRKAFEAGCQNLSKGNAIYELYPGTEHFHR